MKMKKEHFAYIKQGIEYTLAASSRVRQYETGDFPRAHKVKDLQTRFNWDMFRYTVSNDFVHCILYPYLDDTHISTALWAICPKVTRRY